MTATRRISASVLKQGSLQLLRASTPTARSRSASRCCSATRSSARSASASRRCSSSTSCGEALRTALQSVLARAAHLHAGRDAARAVDAAADPRDPERPDAPRTRRARRPARSAGRGGVQRPRQLLRRRQRPAVRGRAPRRCRRRRPTSSRSSRTSRTPSRSSTRDGELLFCNPAMGTVLPEFASAETRRLDDMAPPTIPSDSSSSARWRRTIAGPVSIALAEESRSRTRRSRNAGRTAGRRESFRVHPSRGSAERC